MSKSPLTDLRNALLTGQRMSRDSADFFNGFFNPRPDAVNVLPANAERVADTYRRIKQLKHTDYRPLYELPPNAERVLAMPRALGAPYGAVALRQWAKREQVQARLRIARKRNQ